ncbi:hypothetical protein M404DRAFT_1007402 [Pisolithus tinctorius Marx 270]|uniref:Uncharacterized protein n=1 Tax=Pisolithus tinctorius Marx 270 TaxID=870435 RepID=A0A0C3N3C1_PISTI|nr:hypothetical protein M404DRAFT_1007402 [Pisolithus tinctorius Marx 270]
MSYMEGPSETSKSKIEVPTSCHVGRPRQPIHPNATSEPDNRGAKYTSMVDPMLRN